MRHLKSSLENGCKVMENLNEQESISIKRPDGFPQVECWSVKNTQRKYRIFHETYTFCSVIRGGGDWRYRGESFTSYQSDVMLLEPGNVHITDNLSRKISYDVIFIPVPVVQNIVSGLDFYKPPHLQIATASAKGCFQHFDGFHKAFKRGASCLELESRITNCLSHVFQNFSENLKRSDLSRISKESLDRAKEFIVHHFQEKIALTHLAKLAGTSCSHFLHSFSRQFGIPPHAFQNQVRISKARELLARGVAATELDLGFTDQSHFIRHFRRSVGVTPGRYQRMLCPPSSGWGFKA